MLVSQDFEYRLPKTRLGHYHPNIQSFCQAARQHQYIPQTTKEFTLVVVTTPPFRILLGKKHRGFGQGMFNSFGGKFDHPEESPEDCACRELLEETNIRITGEQMRNSKVGIQRYTFENDPVEMIMHVFRLHLPRNCAALSDIRPCDEITPEWFEDWRQIPLDQMFADDSHWLVALLSFSWEGEQNLQINGSYHFMENCQETNTILHYTMDLQQKPKYTLEQRLFHAIHDNQVHSPSVKEFKECFAFLNIVRSSFAKPRRVQWDVVIDVAGGHGALAAMFLVCTNAKKAVVVDPAEVGKGGVQRAWKQFYKDKTLQYRFECLRPGLPEELKDALSITSPDRILVVACHACQHLSEETLQIASRYGVHAAVMPCCQKDLSPGSSWKTTAKKMSLPIGKVMDILLAGKMMASGKYDVRMKLMDENITPQNRIIVCRACKDGNDAMVKRESEVSAAHAKLEIAYRKAHEVIPRKKRKDMKSANWEYMRSALSLVVGIGVGALVSVKLSRR